MTTVSGCSDAAKAMAFSYASLVVCIFISSPRPISGRMIGGCGTITAPMIDILPPFFVRSTKSRRKMRRHFL